MPNYRKMIQDCQKDIIAILYEISHGSALRIAPTFSSTILAQLLAVIDTLETVRPKTQAINSNVITALEKRSPQIVEYCTVGAADPVVVDPAEIVSHRPKSIRK